MFILLYSIYVWIAVLLFFALMVRALQHELEAFNSHLKGVFVLRLFANNFRLNLDWLQRAGKHGADC